MNTKKLTWHARARVAAFATVLVAATAVGAGPALADHDAPDGSGNPQAGLHEAKPAPPIPAVVVGECQEQVWYFSEVEPGSNLDPLTPRHRHVRFTTSGVGFHCSLGPSPLQSFGLFLDVEVGTDGQADIDADPDDPNEATATHGDTLTQSWSSSDGYCGSFGAADGFPEHVNRGQVFWDASHRSSTGGCLDNWAKFVAGVAVSEGGVPGEFVLWGQVDRSLYGPVPVCFRADLAQVPIPGSTSDQAIYKGPLVFYQQGGFIDSETSRLGDLGTCETTKPLAPSEPSTTLVAPADGATVDLVDGGVEFTIRADHPKPERTLTPWYHGVVEVTDADGNVVVLTTPMQQFLSIEPGPRSGEESSIVATLSPGAYTWTAWAVFEDGVTTPKAPTRSFTINDTDNLVGESIAEVLPPFGDFPSDDCTGGTVLVDGYAGDHYVKIRSDQPNSDTTRVCTRVDGPGLRTGGKLEVSEASGSPTFHEGDAEAAQCGIEIDSGEIGDPDDPATHVPYRLAVDTQGDEVWLCVQVDDESDGGVSGRVVVPTSTGGVQFFPDDPEAHRPVGDAIDSTHPSSTCGTDGEVYNAESAGTHTWVATGESGSKTHVCVRHEGSTSTGGLLTVDSSGDSGVDTSTTDMSPCEFNVFTNNVVSITRSALTTPASVCVESGSTAVRVTVGDTSGDPVVDWQFD